MDIYRWGATYRVGGLVNLVGGSILSSRGTVTEALVVVLGNVLVGLLGSTGGHLAGLVTDVVGGVPEG